MIDLLGQRPLIHKYRQNEANKAAMADVNLRAAKNICTSIQQIIPFLVTNDPERLGFLQQKYLAVVATANDASQGSAFHISEYLFFLDTLLHQHPSARVLGKAILQAWVYSGRAHQQDPNIDDAKFQRLVWMQRIHRGYIGGSSECRDKVLLPHKYIREFGFLPNEGRGDARPWDTQGDLDLTQLLRQATKQHCAGCLKPIETRLRCGACGKTVYCSRSCQKKHWKLGHRELCGTWKANAT